MAAGPGIPPRAPGSPRAALRSARNYPHLLAEELALELVDVTYSGATTAHVLTDRQNGTAPQVSALDGTEDLVTITIGGNDIAYVPGMYVATLPTLSRSALHLVPMVGGRLRDVLDPARREVALERVGRALVSVGDRVRELSPAARVLFVEYPTLLPPYGEKSPPLRREHADLARHLADRLAELTGKAAAATGCELVRVAEPSRAHHAWSEEPWTVGATLPLPGRPLAYHPNAAGMRAVATLVRDHLSENSVR
jgi:lysophospholipase L1-like esterase